MTFHQQGVATWRHVRSGRTQELEREDGGLVANMPPDCVALNGEDAKVAATLLLATHRRFVVRRHHEPGPRGGASDWERYSHYGRQPSSLLPPTSALAACSLSSALTMHAWQARRGESARVCPVTVPVDSSRAFSTTFPSQSARARGNPKSTTQRGRRHISSGPCGAGSGGTSGSVSPLYRPVRSD